MTASHAAKRLLRTAARPLLVSAARLVDPSALAWWLAASSRAPERAAREASLRLGSLVPVATHDIVANYARGIVLFGDPDPRRPPFHWRSIPDRAVITPDTAKVPKRLRPLLRRGHFEIRYDWDVPGVVRACQDGRNGWLTDAAVDAYLRVHDAGFVATVEAYRDGDLVGGFWGIRLGRTLGIMSMFHREDHAGAVALAAAAEDTGPEGRWSLIDCGELNPNFERYGAHEVPASTFSELVLAGLRPARRSGPDGRADLAVRSRSDAPFEPR